MNVTFFRRGLSLLALGSLVASCSSSASPSVTLGTPSQITPANGAIVSNQSQPVVLTVNNAFVSDSSANVVYTFEVSNDQAFGSVLQSKNAPQGAGGTTSVTLDPLPPSQSYFWHVRAAGGSTTGSFSSPTKFTIGAAVSLGAPTAIAPLNNANLSGWQPFTVGNSLKTGPAGPIQYIFEINSNSTFTGTKVLTSQPIAEGAGGQTVFLPAANAPVVPGTYFWRATATDTASGAVSPSSPVQSFVLGTATRQAQLALQLGQTLWPGAQPTGTNGHAVMGDSCDGSPNWTIATCFSPVGQTNFVAPTIEALRYFDLFDRGYDPQSAINWMVSNGYPTAAQWYPPPEKAVLGLGFFYLAARGQVVGPGTIWDIVVGLG